MASTPTFPVRRTVRAYSMMSEGLGLIRRGYTRRIGLVVSDVVGTILSAVNQGPTIAAGHLDAVTWL